MKTIQITRWRDFPDAVADVRRNFASYRIGDQNIHARVLFRGQADSKWPLLTTLERYSNRRWSLKSYSEMIFRCSAQVQSITGNKWDLPTWGDFQKQLESAFDDVFVTIPNYPYWAYLRHYGFPSPLLDWTNSPYIAAFFALEEKRSAESAAVYAFIDSPRGAKIFGDNDKEVHSIGPYVVTDKRHFLQQCWYTVATVIHAGAKDHELICHEDIAAEERVDKNVFIKIEIPRSERLEAMSALHEFNITHSSLFQSQEALMKTMAFQEIELRNL